MIINKRKKLLSCLIGLMLAGSVLSGCGTYDRTGSCREDTDDRGLKIVSTIFAPDDFAMELSLGTDNESIMLLKPGTEVHSYDPTVSDIIAISECDLFIYTGGENDEWVRDILDAIDHPVNTFLMMDHVDVVEEEIKEGMQAHEEGGDEDTEEAEWDEHVWTSPQNALSICRDLADTLTELDPDNTEIYTDNLNRYSEELIELDQGFRQVVDASDRRLMVFADRFPVRYFTEEYGLDYYAAYPGCAADAEPSASLLRFLIDKVSDEDIPYVFYIEMSDQRIADTVCGATGAQKLLFHSCHNVTRDELENGESYISLMDKNLENLKKALG